MPRLQTKVPVALCERCWLSDNTKWEPESIDMTGNILLRLVGVNTPTKLCSGNVDVCGMCGSITIAGIYDLREKDDLPFYEDSIGDSFEINVLDDDDEIIFSMDMDSDEDDEEDEESEH
jgi:hypothetical protein